MEGAIPDGICSLISLKKLDLSRNNFLSIPAGISELTNLKDLRLGQSQNLIEIPELPSCVQDIDPYNCTSLSASSSGVCTLQWLQFLFYNCSKPVEDESSVSSLTTLAVVMQKFLENIAFSVVFPGIEIPEWIWHQNVRSSIKIELPTDWYNDDFLGFVVCSVLEHFPGKITCHLNSDVLGYGKIMKDFSHDLHSKGNNVGSKHVWLGYQPLVQLRLLPFIDPNDLSQIELSFEATNRFSSRASNVVKKCGVRLIYAEDLEGIHPDNIQYSSRVGYDVVKRSSDREGSNGCGRGYSSSGCSYKPTNNPMLKLKHKPLQDDYHHPISSFNKIFSSVDMAMHA
ncbi:disease resistance protein RPS4-like [Vitis riparia]|uniref:disease resistance protein RPS4-like n=1 Tax=Vitis riparia TaxID=96939 RepID=UPI00155B268F|nr:disease resistance protein RPS4-like [Vitis riparia]